jgi:multiple sugar transport system substrate-binding protein
MSNLKLMTVEYNQDSVCKLNEVFERFQRKTGHSVAATYINWDAIWQELLNTGIYRRGPDLSEIGTTWLYSMISMNALHSFNDRETRQIGGSQAFLPGAWDNARFGSGKELFSVPFRVDVRMVHFWRDYLEGAGVEPETAFQTPAAFRKTLETLQKKIPKPFAVASHVSDHNTVYDSASWVWANGGDFIDPEGKRVLFDQPTALEAFREYFELYRYIPTGNMHTADVLKNFIDRNVAVITLGPWLRSNLKEQNRFDLLPKLGIASPPGPAFVGGSALAIWQHARYTDEAVELVSYLVSPEVQAEFIPLTGMLPASKAAWAMPQLKDDPLLSVFYEPLLHGRAFTRASIWGMIEHKLIAEMSQIWNEIFSTPDPEVEVIVKKHLVPLARRLNITLNT